MTTPEQWLEIIRQRGTETQPIGTLALIAAIQGDALQHAADIIEGYASKNADILDSMNPISVTKTYLLKIRAAAMPNEKS